MVAKGFQKTLSKTSLLANFLPASNILTFETLVPTVYRGGGGECTYVTTLMIPALLPLCVLSCFFFHFTDNFCVPDRRVYYGFVTPNGLAMFKPGIEVQVSKEERYRLGLSYAGTGVLGHSVFGLPVTDGLFVPGLWKGFL